MLHKPLKYKNKKTIIDEIKFDSQAESLYYVRLKAQQKTGLIRHFTLQPKFILQEGFKTRGETVRQISYIADFLVTDSQGNQRVIDIKGFPSPMSKLKRSFFLKRYPELPLYWIRLKNHAWENMKGEIFDL